MLVPKGRRRLPIVIKRYLIIHYQASDTSSPHPSISTTTTCRVKVKAFSMNTRIEGRLLSTLEDENRLRKGERALSRLTKIKKGSKIDAWWGIGSGVSRIPYATKRQSTLKQGANAKENQPANNKRSKRGALFPPVRLEYEKIRTT
jgi:hypothetical protein